MNKNTSNNESNTSKSFHVDSRNGFMRFIKPAYYTVWTVLGIMIITLLSIAIFGSGTWQENLNISEPAEIEQPAQQQQQPAQQQQQQPEAIEPTEEQLACIAEQIGDERLFELQQGADVESQDEAAVVEACLLEQEQTPQPEAVEPEPTEE